MNCSFIILSVEAAAGDGITIFHGCIVLHEQKHGTQLFGLGKSKDELNPFLFTAHLAEETHLADSGYSTLGPENL